MQLVRKKHPLFKLVYRYTLITIGAVMAAAALSIFLLPNQIIDGGIVGISIMASHFTNISIGLYTFVLNIPFLLLGYKHIGKSFLVSSLFSIIVFSLALSYFAQIDAPTDDVLIAAIFGGMILGAGVGIIIRYGGSLDGTEMIAIIISRTTMFSVGQIVMFFNIFILGTAGVVFGFDKAMYSMLTYFVAFRVIDIVVEGLDEAKAAMIVSEHSEEIAEMIMLRLGRGVTFLFGEGGYNHNKFKVIYVIVTRIEISKLGEIVKDIDESAFVTIHNVSDVVGRSMEKNYIH